MTAETWARDPFGLLLCAHLAIASQGHAAIASSYSNGCSFEMVEIEAPYVVRSVSGRLLSEGGDWPEGVVADIELRKDGSKAVKYRGSAAPTGRFEIPAVGTGRYRFRADVRRVGWACVVGTIVVSRSAPDNAAIEITIPLGK